MMFASIDSEFSSVKYAFYSFKPCFRQSTIFFLRRYSVRFGRSSDVFVDRKWVFVGKVCVGVKQSIFLCIENYFSSVKFSFWSVKRCFCWPKVIFTGIMCRIVCVSIAERMFSSINSECCRWKVRSVGQTMSSSINDWFLSVKCVFLSVKRCFRRSTTSFCRWSVRLSRSNDVFVGEVCILVGQSMIL